MFHSVAQLYSVTDRTVVWFKAEGERDGALPFVVMTTRGVAVAPQQPSARCRSPVGPPARRSLESEKQKTEAVKSTL